MNSTTTDKDVISPVVTSNGSINVYYIRLVIQLVTLYISLCYLSARQGAQQLSVQDVIPDQPVIESGPQSMFYITWWFLIWFVLVNCCVSFSFLLKFQWLLWLICKKRFRMLMMATLKMTTWIILGRDSTSCYLWPAFTYWWSWQNSQRKTKSHIYKSLVYINRLKYLWILCRLASADHLYSTGNQQDFVIIKLISLVLCALSSMLSPMIWYLFLVWHVVSMSFSHEWQPKREPYYSTEN